MANSSPTAHERIRRAATVQAYANARRLGIDPIGAYREADVVGKFIDDTMEVEPRVPREIYATLLRRFINAVE